MKPAINRQKFFSIFSILSVLVLLLTSPVLAQQDIHLVIHNIESDSFPEMKAIVSVTDSQNIPIKELSTSNFSLQEDNGSVINPNTFILREHPLAVVLVVDESRSMGYGSSPTPFDSVIEASRQLIGSLLPNDQVALIAMGEKPLLMQELTGDKNLIVNGLNRLSPKYDRTALYDALQQAVDLLKGRSERLLIVLTTDGVDSKNRPGIDKIVEAATRNSITVFPVVWGGANKEEMKQLADLTRGQLYYIDTPLSYPTQGSIDSAFSAILIPFSEFRLQYLLNWNSSLPADGGTHNLSVTAEFGGRSVSQTSSFEVPVGEVVVSFPDFSECQKVGGLVKFSPQISSPTTPTKMEIIMDGATPLDTDSTPPLEYIWDSTNIPPAEHQFTIIVEDKSGNKGQTNICLTIVDPVTVKITSPLGGPVDNMKPVQIAADVQAIAGVAKVEIIADGNVLKTLETAPFETAWNIVDVSKGQHEISVRATDINGFVGEDNVKISTEAVDGDGLGGIVLAGAVGLGVLVLVVSGATRIRRKKKAASGALPVTDVVGESSGRISPSEGLPHNGVASQAVLVEKHGINPGMEWRIPINQEFRLGRKRADNDVPLMGATASRQQAEILFQNGEYVWFNLREENPAIINGSQIAHQQVLRPGDEIQVGESIFEFQIKE